MADPRKLNLFLTVAAAAVLIVSFSALAYTMVPSGQADVLIVNGAEYAWADIFEDFQMHDFTVDDTNYTGACLEELLLDAGVTSPESHNYRLKARDTYQQDVSWADMRSGYLIELGPAENDFHRAIFPGSAHSFWVYDLASIEVV